MAGRCTQCLVSLIYRSLVFIRSIVLGFMRSRLAILVLFQTAMGNELAWVLFSMTFIHPLLLPTTQIIGTVLFQDQQLLYLQVSKVLTLPTYFANYNTD